MAVGGFTCNAYVCKFEYNKVTNEIEQVCDQIAVTCGGQFNNK